MEDKEEIIVTAYPQNLLKGFYKLQKENNLCDVHLTAEDGKISAHRLLLMVSSPYFRNQLSSSEVTLMNNYTIHFDDIPLHMLEMVVKFLYTGKLYLSKENVSQVLKVCDDLRLTSAVKACKDFSEGLKTVDSDIEEGGENIPEDNEENEKVEKLTIKIPSELQGKDETRSAIVTNRRVKQTPRKRTSPSLSEVSIVDLNAVKQELQSPDRKRGRTSSGRSAVKKSPTSMIGIQNTPRARGRPRKNQSLKSVSPRKAERTPRNIKKPSIKRKKVKLEEDISRDEQVTSKESTPKDVSEKKSMKVESFDEESEKLIVDFPPDKDYSDSDDVDNDDDDDDNDYVPKTNKNVTTSNTKEPKKRLSTRKKRAGYVRIKKKFPCSLCDRILSSKRRLVFHEFSKHDIPFDKTNFKVAPCPEENCTYIAINKHNLQTHMKSRHGNDRPHICEFCGKGFKLPNVLATHRNIHTGSKVFQCKECGERFSQQSGLDIHVKRKHMGESAWTELCHLCSEKFVQKSELCWHLFKTHNQPLPDKYKAYSCDLCSFITKSVQDLDRHKNAHEGIKQFKCDICSKSCSTKSELKRHKTFHGEKKFKCQYEGCTYACVDAIGLNTHTRLMHTHKNYKPYICSVCPYKTGVKGNLDKHIRTVHNLEVVTKHTVHLRMKYQNLQAGDIITKDGKLVATAQQRKIQNAFKSIDSRMEDISAESDFKQDGPLKIVEAGDAMYIAPQEVAIHGTGMTPQETLPSAEPMTSQSHTTSQDHSVIQGIPHPHSQLMQTPNVSREYANNYVSTYHTMTVPPLTAHIQVSHSQLVAQDLRTSLQSQLNQSEMYPINASSESGQYVTAKYTEFSEI